MIKAAEQTVILIPAYKPTEALIALCKTLHHDGFSIVCVDDGSGDAFGAIFDDTAHYADVLSYPVNKGKGGALKVGIRHIAASPQYENKKYIVTADADGQHKPEDIYKVADKVCSSGGFVVGVRQFTGKVPARSRFGNSITKLVFALASGKKLTDTQTGLRAFEKAHAEIYLETPGERYEYEMNVLFSVVEEKIPLGEVPIETVYENNNEGSHFRPIRDSYRIYKSIFLSSKSIKFLFSSCVAFVIDYTLALFLTWLLPGEFAMEVALILAWITSSLTNFFINRNFVFGSTAPLAKAMPAYYALAVCVFAGKVLVVEFLTRFLHIPLWITKLFAEVIFFVSNYFIQKKIIFRRKRRKSA